MEVCRASLSQGLTPLSLASHDSRSVLAVKGSLRRFAPWTAPGRSEGMAVYEGKVRYGFGPCGRLSRSSGVEVTRRCRSEAKESALERGSERRVPHLVSAGNLNPTGLASINSTTCFISTARTRPGFSRA